MKRAGGNGVPDGCDCCGRDAEDCGMLDDGWVVDAHLLAAGTYCRGCAHLLRIVRLEERCTWCGTAMVEEELAETLGWGYFVDVIGNLHACCPSCLAGQFGLVDRPRADRAPEL